MHQLVLHRHKQAFSCVRRQPETHRATAARLVCSSPRTPGERRGAVPSSKEMRCEDMTQPIAGPGDPLSSSRRRLRPSSGMCTGLRGSKSNYEIWRFHFNIRRSRESDAKAGTQGFQSLAPLFMPGAGPGSPLSRGAVRGNFSCKDDLLRTQRKPFKVVLRGLDPRIHVFASGVRRRGWPAQAK
jgi:hypothetical protein